MSARDGRVVVGRLQAALRQLKREKMARGKMLKELKNALKKEMMEKKAIEQNLQKTETKLKGEKMAKQSTADKLLESKANLGNAEKGLHYAEKTFRKVLRKKDGRIAALELRLAEGSGQEQVGAGEGRVGSPEGEAVRQGEEKLDTAGEEGGGRRVQRARKEPTLAVIAASGLSVPEVLRRSARL
jgi:hypothetical protein